MAYRTRGCFLSRQALQQSAHSHEPWLDSVYQTVLGCKEGAFIDVGANIGQTMLKIISIDKARQYVGFDPQISCYRFIQSFIDDNGLTQCAIFPFGLSSNNQFVRLYSRGRNCDTTASTIDNFRPLYFYTSYQHVFVRRGDECIEELKVNPISAIKIDVEGGELEVVEGLVSTIQSMSPFLIFEILNHYLDEHGRPLGNDARRFRESRAEKLESLLKAWHYSIFNILPGNLLKNIKKLELRDSSDLSITNYIAIPKINRKFFLEAFPGHVEDC